MSIGQTLSAIFRGIANFINEAGEACSKNSPIDTNIMNPGGPEVRTDYRYEMGPSIDANGHVDCTPGWKSGPRTKL